ncbi:MAG: diaminopimelate epimerase [Dehalococcoidia bacterium]|nr:diaminopimelate epimerase [Dehalococcoidia bacterium]
MKFVKMHGTGNDFIVIDARGLRRDWVKLAQKICDRHFGIGSDGLLLVLPARRADFRMRMFNPDGSEAEICGNGIRCFAKYVIDQGLTEKNNISVETLAGVKHVKTFLRNGQVQQVRVNMGAPHLQPADIPIRGDFTMSPVVDYPLTVAGRTLFLTFVNMGNPHAVTFIDEPVEQFALSEIGPQVERHPLFPKRTNFEIVNVMGKGKLQARVWERGAGLTLSCGSGACAVAVAAKLKDYTDTKVDITLPGGNLTLEWAGKGDVFLTGPAVEVFEGEWGE